MKGKQLLAIAGALVLIVVLAMLPKAVLKKPGAEAEANRDQAKTESPASSKKEEDTQHARSLNDAQEAKMKTWRVAFSKKAYMQDASLADSIANTFIEVGLYDSAAYYREVVAQQNPTATNLMLAGDVNYDAYTLALNEERKKKYISAARDWYTKSEKADPKNLDAKAKLGLTFVDSDNPMQGILMLRDVIKANPKHELATYNLGMFAMQTKQWDKAVERFQALTGINPNSTQAWFYLGVSLKELGKLAEAKEALQKARSLTQDPEVQSSIDEALSQLNPA